MIVGVFLGYRLNSSVEKEEYNPFVNSNNISNSDQSLITIDGKPFPFAKLPIGTKNSLYRMEESYYFNRLTTLRDFAVRYLVSVDANRDFNIETLPSLMEVFKTAVSDKEIDKIFPARSKKMDPKLDDTTKRAKLKMELAMKRIPSLFSDKVLGYKNANRLSINLSPPPVPVENFEKLEYPQIGAKDSATRLIGISNYFSPAAQKRQGELKEVFQNHPNLIYTQVNYSRNITDPSGMLIKAARCVFQEDKEKFWKFHINLLGNKRLLAQTKFDNKSILGLINNEVKKIGSDFKSISTCIETDRRMHEIVRTSQRLVYQLGLIQSPTFVLNGKILELDSRSLSKIISDNL